MKLLSAAVAALAVGLVALLPAAAGAAPKKKPKPTYYLSLGDSLSASVQPGPVNDPGQQAATVNTDEGYTEQLYAMLRRQTRGLRLVKAGCGGATTGSFINGGPGVIDVPGCTPARRTPYEGTSPATSQLAWAERFLRRHRGRVRYVTVDVGSNDLDACASGGQIDVACVATGTAEIKANLPEIARRLRRAAGSRVPIAGATLYDPYLSSWLGGAAGQAVASASQALAGGINADTIIPAYTEHRVAVARVDQALDSDVPLTQTTTTPALGTVPVAVAGICASTWMCAPAPAGPNIHPNEAGYGRMARAFAAALRSQHR